MGGGKIDDFQRMRYVSLMRPLFRKRAVFSDESRFYRTPYEPKSGENVTIRLRTLKNNADVVYLVSGSRRWKMTRAKTEGSFDYYEVSIPVGDETIFYYFEIRLDDLVFHYTKQGVDDDLAQRNLFRIVPGFTTPDWAHGAVMYQIYTDRFCNGDPNNDVLTREYFYTLDPVQKIDDWYTRPANRDIGNFYGGDLEGIRQKLDYLQELGVDVLYLNPIFVSPSNHKYDCQDYDHIDPHIGRIVKDQGNLLGWGDADNTHATRYICRVADPVNLEASDELFAELTAEIHRRGMKIILDGVFNHCGSFNKWMDRERIYENEKGYEKGAYVDGESPYRSFFQFKEDWSWPYNKSYEGWWNHDTLPKLNYEGSQKLFEYILYIGRKWTSPPYSVDGWRLDVAADLGHSPEYNHYFWREFRKAVKSANPEAIILAEHYGECSSWLEGDQWDTVMNYDAFMEPVSWFLTGMEKHSDHFRGELLGNGSAFESAMNYHMASFMGTSLECAMNQLDNHDHSRFLTRTNHWCGRVASLGSDAADNYIVKELLRSAVVIQMTYVGAPTLYYGDEAGVTGFTDPDNRRVYPWGKEDQDLIEFYRTAIRVHHSSEAFRVGSQKLLGCGYHFISYGRFTDEECFIVAVNAGEEAIPVELPVWEIGISRTKNSQMMVVLTTSKEGWGTDRTLHLVNGGILTLDLKPYEAVVLKPVTVEEEIEAL